MKLTDMNNKSSSKISELLKAKFGYNLDLNKISEDKAKKLYNNVTESINVYKSKHGVTKSEANPHYTQLLLVREGLAKFISEKWDAEMHTAEKDKGKWDGWSITKLKARKEKLMAKEKRSAAEQKEVKQINFALRAKQKDGKWGKIKESVEVKPQPTIAEQILEATDFYTISRVLELSSKRDNIPSKYMESFKRLVKSINENTRVRSILTLTEGELESAQAILAAKDFVDRLQDMLEESSKMLNEDLPPLLDAIRDQIGMDQAAAYNSEVSGVVAGLVDSIRQAREAVDNSTRMLAGGQAQPMTMPPEAGAAPQPGQELGPDELAGIAAAGGEVPAEPEAETPEVQGVGRERR
jgi:hypothetical protein